MIHLTRINHKPLLLNSDLIEHIEATPDTVITLTNGQKLVVTDSQEAVVEKIIEFRRSILVPKLEDPKLEDPKLEDKERPRETGVGH